jgi:hypothetical protein
MRSEWRAQDMEFLRVNVVGVNLDGGALVRRGCGCGCAYACCIIVGASPRRVQVSPAGFAVFWRWMRATFATAARLHLLWALQDPVRLHGFIGRVRAAGSHEVPPV